MNQSILKLSQRSYSKEGQLLPGSLQEEICIFKTSRELCDALPASKKAFGAFRMLKQCKGSPVALGKDGSFSVPDKPIPIQVCIKETEMRNIDLDCGEKPPECTSKGCNVKIGVRRMKIRGKLHITNLNTGELLLDPQVLDFRVTPNAEGELASATAKFLFDRNEKRIEMAAKLQRGQSDVNIAAGSLWVSMPMVSLDKTEQEEEDLIIYNELAPILKDANRRAKGDKSKILRAYQDQLKAVENNLVRELAAEAQSFGEKRDESDIRKSVRQMLKDNGVDVQEFANVKPLDLSQFASKDVEAAKIEWVRSLPVGYELMQPIQEARTLIRAKQFQKAKSNARVVNSWFGTALTGAYVNGKMQNDPRIQKLINKQVVMRISPNIENNINALLERLPYRLNKFIDAEEYDSEAQAITLKAPGINLNRKNQFSMLAKKYDKSGELAAQGGSYEAALLQRHRIATSLKNERELELTRTKLEKCRGRVNSGYCKDLEEEFLRTSKEVDEAWEEIDYYSALLNEDIVKVDTLYALDKFRKVNEALKLNLFNDCIKDCDRDIDLQNFDSKEIPEDVDLRTEVSVEGLQKLIDQMYEQKKLDVCRGLVSGLLNDCEGIAAKLKSPPQIRFENGQYKLKIPNLKVDLLGEMKFSEIEVKPRLCGDGLLCLDSSAFKNQGTIRMNIAKVDNLVRGMGQEALTKLKKNGLPAVPYMKANRLLQNKNNGAIAIDWQIDSVNSKVQVYKSMKALQDLGF